MDTVPSQLNFNFFNCFCILPFWIIYMILIKIINWNIWCKWRFHFFAIKKIPIKIIKPGMLFQFLNSSFVTDPRLRISLKTFIYKICWFNRPTFWNFKSFYLHLTTKNLFSNFFTSSTNIWSATLHAFICHYTNCKIVRW